MIPVTERKYLLGHNPEESDGGQGAVARRFPPAPGQRHRLGMPDQSRGFLKDNGNQEAMTIMALVSRPVAVIFIGIVEAVLSPEK